MTHILKRIAKKSPFAVRMYSKITGKGVNPVRELDLSRLELIRKAASADLSSATYIEQSLMPKLGFNNEGFSRFPSELAPYAGQGLFIWQYPKQFSKYLLQLSKLGIRSYLEIGIRHGGTFVTTVEYLKRFAPIDRAVAVDINDCPSVAAYASATKGVSFLKADSAKPKFKEFVRTGPVYDLALIDGDHSEEMCRNDYEVMRDRANALAFHDIEPHACVGVAKVWSDLKREHAAEYDFYEFRDQYTTTELPGPWMGIGLAVRKQKLG